MFLVLVLAYYNFSIVRFPGSTKFVLSFWGPPVALELKPKTLQVCQALMRWGYWEISCMKNVSCSRALNSQLWMYVYLKDIIRWNFKQANYKHFYLNCSISNLKFLRPFKNRRQPVILIWNGTRIFFNNFWDGNIISKSI